jgi:branched-chain amino acid transport system ATP-binding protein
VLSVREVNTYYGHIHALKDVSLEVGAGEIVAILGANGAGKSTLIKTIMGFRPCRSGEVWFDGRKIDRLSPERIVRRGVSIVFETREMFAPISVRQNLEIGAYARRRARQCNRRQLATDLDEVYRLFPILKAKMNDPSGSLSGGQQQMLAIGRALMSKPRLMLLDEPSMGLAPLLVKEIFRTIKNLADLGVTMLLVEQNSRAALSICDRAYIMQTGSVAMNDTAANLRNNPDLARLYLGEQVAEEPS